MKYLSILIALAIGGRAVSGVADGPAGVQRRKP